MIIYKELFGILIIVGLLSNQLDAENSFDYSVAPRTIQPGSHAELRIRVPLNPSDSESSIEVKDELLFKLEDIYILEKTSERTDCCLNLKYIITGYKDHNSSLPPIEIKAPGNTFSTESVPLSVQSSRSLEDNELREVFDTIAKPIPYFKWLRVLFGLALLAGAFTYIFKKWKTRKKTVKRPVKTTLPILVEDPNEWIRKQLVLLKTKLKNEPNNQWLVDDWSDILRGYLFRKKSLPAQSWTTTEIKKTLLNDPFVAPLVPCLEQSDLIKFSPNSDSDQKISELVHYFITETESRLALCGN